MSDKAAIENMERYVYMRDNGHLDYIKKHKQCNDFVKNHQWAEEDKAKLALAKRPALTINKILPGMAAVWGEQLENQSDIVYRPAKGGTQEVADVLSKVWLYTSNTNNLMAKQAHVFDTGTISGRAYFDVRMDFSDSIFGEVRINVMNPINVLLDPDADEYDPDTWKEVVVTRWLSEEDIGQFYGKQYQKELQGRTKSDAYLSYDFIDYKPGTFGGDTMRVADDAAPHRKRLRVIERQFRKLVRREHFVDMITGDTRIIPENMPREKISLLMQEFGLNIIKRDTQIIHWTTSADNIVLHDEDSPYKHFTPVPYFPFFIDGEPIGLVESQIDPQELYNKSTSQILHIINTTANSGYKVKRGALQNMDIEDVESRGAETGIVFELDDVGNLEKIQPNQIPSGLDRVAFIAANDLKELSMVSDSMRGFDRADVAAKAIMAKQSRGSTNFAKPMNNLNMTMYFLARNSLDLFQTYYTEERVMQITGGDLDGSTEEFTINQMTPEGRVINDLTLGEYSVRSVNVPSRRNFEDTQFDEAVQLRELGINIPDDVIIEHSHLSRKAEIAKRIRERNGEGDPTEMQQEMAQIELQLKQLEAAKAKAEEDKIKSEAALNLVKAQKESEDVDTSREDNKALGEAQIKYDRMIRELELKKYQIDQELSLKREEMQGMLELKREEIRQRSKESQEQKPKEAKQ